jgi:hypothetical protein
MVDHSSDEVLSGQWERGLRQALAGLPQFALHLQNLPETNREPMLTSQGGNLHVQLGISEVCDGDCFTVMGAGVGQQAREPLCQSCVCPLYLLFQAA